MSEPQPRLLLATTAPAAQQVIATFHRDFVEQVIAAVGSHRVVVVGMAQNPFVGKAHRALKRAGIAFHAINHGSYLSGYKRRLAVKMWSGYPTFPQIFVDGTLIGGFIDLEAAINTGTLKA
jgi:monothiol glutaredoxin